MKNEDNPTEKVSDMDASNPTCNQDLAWDTELTNHIRRGEKIKVEATTLFLIASADLKEFEDSLGCKKYILVGLKGTGKSLALSRKASRFGRDKNRKTVPSYYPYFSAFTEQCLSTSLGKITDKAVYCSHYFWTRIWKLAISTIFVYSLNKHKTSEFGTYLCKNTHESITKGEGAEQFFNIVGQELKKLEVAKQEGITLVLNLILTRKYSANICQDWFEYILKCQLFLKEEYECTAIFIDQIDEALIDYRNISSNKTNTYIPQNIWEAAQTGLIDASASIAKETNDSFRVFAAIRLEAFRKYADVGAKGNLQKNSNCIEIVYDIDDLKEIFIGNIKLTPNHDLAIPKEKEKDAILSFFGTLTYKHPYVTSVEENPIDWIRRHTLGSPRELVYIGAQIYTLNKEKRVNRDMMSKTINSAAHMIFKDYKRFMVPEWNLDVENYYPYIRHNVLTKVEDVPLIRSKVDEINANNSVNFCPLKYLYNNGLLGVPESTGSDTTKYIQKFLDVRSRGGNVELPNASYYLVHPILYKYIIDRLEPEEKDYFHNRLFVVGDGLYCPSDLLPPKLIILIKSDEQMSYISYVPDNNKIWINTDQIESNFLDNFNLYDGAIHPVILLHAIIFAMDRFKKNQLNVDQICESIEFFVKNNLCSNATGNTKNLSKTAEYFQKQLHFSSSDHPSCYKDLKTLIKNSSLKNPFSVKHSRNENNRTFSFEGLKFQDIRVIFD